MFNQRSGAVLKTLVQEYITTATPVPSENIARRAPIKVSSATVRNKMAELEEAGYILRPHISAGGVPSHKGYRFYVESLDDDLELPVASQHEVMGRFRRGLRDLEEWVEQAASVLAELSGNMAVVTYPRAASPRIKAIQVVQLQDLLALLIVVLNEARLKKNLIPLDGPVGQNDFTSVSNKLNSVYAGLTYNQMLNKTVELTPFESLVREETLRLLKEDDEKRAAEHSVDGLRLLLSQPEFAEPGKAKEVAGLLEDGLLVKSFMAKAAEQQKVSVHIGEENAEGPLKSFSVIICQYGIPDEASGVVGVVGPTRLAYSNVISGVKFLSGFMDEMMSSVHPGH
ncbi:MAG: heat-inducible transcription repressor HrcA [SAR202 cluster bacterium]|nr:heat-inducible transcription repressor HrcA [SAR202 cluster bacterium]